MRLPKIRNLLVIFIIFAILLNVNSAELPTLSVAEDRIESGDYSVIGEAAEAGGVEGLQLLTSLSRIFSFSKNKELYPEVSRLALEAIKEVDGHGKIFKEEIEKLTKEEFTIRRRVKIFKFLGKIDSDEVVSILIDYLDDNRVIESRDWIQSYLEESGELPLPFGANQTLAAKSLNNLKLEGAPVSKQSRYGVAPLQEWLRWKETRGESPIRMVPALGEGFL